MTEEIPLIWTAKGNLPLSELGMKVIWEKTDTYAKIQIVHTHYGEEVRREAHVLALQPLTSQAQAGNL